MTFRSREKLTQIDGTNFEFYVIVRSFNVMQIIRRICILRV